MNNYNKFNDIATECDLLEQYLKDGQSDMTRYQYNQLRNRLELKRIKREVLANHVDWDALDEPKAIKPNGNVTILYDLMLVICAILITIMVIASL